MAEPTDYGVASCVVQLAAHQASLGWTTHVLAPLGGTLAGDLAGTGVTFVPWGAGRSAGSAARDLLSLRSTIKGIGPDVVHLHSSKAGALGRLALRGSVPTMFQPHAWSFFALHGAARRGMTAFERVTARWADVIVCCSAEERDQANEVGIGGRLEVVPNAVDLERFRPQDRAEARQRLGLGPEPLAVCVGRICPQKGQRELLAAWPPVAAAVPGATLAFVGEGPERAELEAAAPPSVRFLGHRHDVTDWLAAADVVVLLSRYEGMSLAVLEAMASGRSLVVTDVTGMRETVGDGASAAGAVVPAGDLGAASDAVVVRLSEPDRCAAEGANGRRRAEADHDRRRWVERFAELTAACAS